MRRASAHRSSPCPERAARWARVRDLGGNLEAIQTRQRIFLFFFFLPASPPRLGSFTNNSKVEPVTSARKSSIRDKIRLHNVSSYFSPSNLDLGFSTGWRFALLLFEWWLRAGRERKGKKQGRGGTDCHHHHHLDPPPQGSHTSALVKSYSGPPVL